MQLSAASRFQSWCARDEDAFALLLFRRAFALLWLTYDLCDFAFGGTAADLWLVPGNAAARLGLLQLALVVAQALLVWGFRPSLLALLCFALRASEAYWFLSLNDFYYYCVVMLILSQIQERPGMRVLSWPRDVLIWQAGWIYFATALLKLNPEWLSGGHLFVRFQYMAEAFQWPYPTLFRSWTAVLAHDAWLAWAGVATEFVLAFLLMARMNRWLILPAAFALHSFAALTANVWFFGAAMLLQVALSR